MMIVSTLKGLCMYYLQPEHRALEFRRTDFVPDISEYAINLQLW